MKLLPSYTSILFRPLKKKGLFLIGIISITVIVSTSLFSNIFIEQAPQKHADTISQAEGLKVRNALPFADSVRRLYHIPELAYAVISSTDILELQVLGVRKIHTVREARPDDRFRIGSNTKAITGFIAAELVKQDRIKWDTEFFDLYPELKAKSNKAYHHLTLLNLLTFRTRLFSYTYTYSEPAIDRFKGNEDEQRFQFTKWFFQHQPVPGRDSFHFSNLGYVAAGLMLEKVSGKTYKELVADLGKRLGVYFAYGNPNTNDSLQPWGHNSSLVPEPPGDNFRLNWLLPAGNINMNLPDYAKFIQL
jgi:CubicO group peptidase (beta-lactamase class C family)